VLCVDVMLMATSATSTARTRRGTSPSRAGGAKAARRRRLRAGRLFEQGLSQAEVARRLHTSPQNVSRWHAKWRQGGRAALAGPTRLGRPPRLSDSDWRRVERALLAGPPANGFDTELWTLPRVAEVIWRLTRVSYHPGHVWWLLRRHQWSPQRPARRATERNDAEVARWVAEEWPRIKGGRQRGARGSASWTSRARR
jgi:transposase